MKLILFYGRDCSNCEKMEPIIEKLEQELSVKFTRREVWHHPRNAGMMIKYSCKKLPMFLNKDSGDYVCGPVTDEELRAWLQEQMQLHGI